MQRLSKMFYEKSQNMCVTSINFHGIMFGKSFVFMDHPCSSCIAIGKRNQVRTCPRSIKCKTYPFMDPTYGREKPHAKLVRELFSLAGTIDHMPVGNLFSVCVRGFPCGLHVTTMSTPMCVKPQHLWFFMRVLCQLRQVGHRLAWKRKRVHSGIQLFSRFIVCSITHHYR